MRKIVFIAIAAFLYMSEASVQAQDKTVGKIIELGKTDNRTMQHVDFLANRIGGRPVGSHSLEDAEKWVAKQFRSWGLEVMVQEVGEINVGFSRGPWFGRMLGPESMDLHFGTPSYTAGTRGPQRGHVIMEPRNRREMNQLKGALKGAWVLISGVSGFAIDRSAHGDSLRAARIAENEEIAKQNAEIRKYNNENPNEPKAYIKEKEMPALFYREMVEAGVLGFIQSTQLPMQLLYDRANCYQMTMDNLPTVCDIKLDSEQYELIKRKVMNRKEVLLEFDIRNHFFEGPVKYHNVIGIMRGTKYPDEYVLAGGHLDAYDGATGAVDDGQGVSVAMEAARLLATAGAKPKRSIMFCVWTGEEYGLLGSKYFVQHATVPLQKISNYFNRDSGPTVTTSITVPEAMYDDFQQIAKPLADLNPDFPFSVIKREGAPGPRPTKAGGSDHAYFAMNGVPTLSLNLEDKKGYGFNYRDIWHTDQDLYNRVIPEYVDHSSIVTAIMLYGVANLNHLLDRNGLYNN